MSQQIYGVLDQDLLPGQSASMSLHEGPIGADGYKGNKVIVHGHGLDEKEFVKAGKRAVAQWSRQGPGGWNVVTWEV